MRELITFLVGSMSLFAFCLMGADKGRAIARKRRVPERSLWKIAIFGGGVGACLAMWVFRHKTQHNAFRVGFPLLAGVELLLLGCIWYLF